MDSFHFIKVLSSLDLRLLYVVVYRKSMKSVKTDELEMKMYQMMTIVSNNAVNRASPLPSMKWRGGHRFRFRSLAFNRLGLYLLSA